MHEASVVTFSCFVDWFDSWIYPDQVSWRVHTSPLTTSHPAAEENLNCLTAGSSTERRQTWGIWGFVSTHSCFVLTLKPAWERSSVSSYRTDSIMKSTLNMSPEAIAFISDPAWPAHLFLAGLRTVCFQRGSVFWPISWTLWQKETQTSAVCLL